MKNHRHQLQRILVMLMSVAMVFTMSACRNSDEDEMQQYMEEYNAKLAEYQDFGTWKQQIQSEPAGDDYKVYTIIGIQDAMKDYIGDSIQELFNDIQVESLAYDGRITYVGVDDGVDKNLEIVDIIMRAAGFDLETEINAENGVVVEPRTRNWKATENSNYDDWVAKASKNLNTLLFQQVVVCPQNMTQVSGGSEGVTVSNNVITLDFMSMKKDETVQFAPLLSWSVDVECGGTQEAWQKLGLTVPSDADTVQYAGKNMLVTHASYSANTVQNDLKLHDVVKMADSNALMFLPSEQWLQGTVGYADGGVRDHEQHQEHRRTGAGRILTSVVFRRHIHETYVEHAVHREARRRSDSREQYQRECTDGGSWRSYGEPRASLGRHTGRSGE